MNCRTNCPEVCKSAETIMGLAEQIVHMNKLSVQNDAALEANKNTATVLAGLPNTHDVAVARSALQEAIVEVNAAKEQISGSIGLLNNAIELTSIAVDGLINVCPGAPVEVPDPNQAGRMMLVCASPAL